MSLWDQGGSTLDRKTAAQIKIENGKAFSWRGEQDWQETDDVTGSFASGGGFMSFLSGARNIVNSGCETRNGITFTRYTFELDGPGYAAYMRDQLQARMAQQGKLP